MIDEAVLREYANLDPLNVRIEAHRSYSEHADLLDEDLAKAIVWRESCLKVLDAGCGTARFLRLIASRGDVDLHACDLSISAVAAARRVVGNAAVAADVRQLPFAENIFDVAFARHMLYHVPDPVRALSELRRITAIGGRVAASVNVQETLPRINAAIQRALDGAGVASQRPANYCDETTLITAMEDLLDGVVVTRRANYLRFDESEAVIRYAVACLGVYGIDRESEAWWETTSRVASEVRSWFRKHGTPWRDPKGYVVCTGINSKVNL